MINGQRAFLQRAQNGIFPYTRGAGDHDHQRMLFKNFKINVCVWQEISTLKDFPMIITEITFRSDQMNFPS
jgi:hypothetical protein